MPEYKCKKCGLIWCGWGVGKVCQKCGGELKALNNSAVSKQREK